MWARESAASADREDHMASAAVNYRIALIPGDGIGVEVTEAARLVLERCAAVEGFSWQWTELDWGCDRYLRTGALMPDDGMQLLADADAIFLGAVGTPGVPDHVSLWGLLIPIRRGFDQYVNLRPARLLPGVRSPLAGRSADDLDFVVVRENSEGEYSTIGGRHRPGHPDEVVVQSALFTRHGTERIVRYAFDLARGRAAQVTGATKSNGIIHTMPFFDEIFREVGSEYMDIESELVHIDALAARFVLEPRRLGVVVGSNLFGDILSDLGAAIVGGLGLAPSGNINPDASVPSMFESVHGSAPDIAGQGIADPTAQILAGAMMLDHLGRTSAGDRVRAAVDTVLGEGRTVTPDLGGAATTAQMANAIAEAVPGATA